MRKTVLLSLFLLCAVWAFAQAYPSQNPSQSTAGQTASSAGNEQTVEGCLNESGGNYTITDSSGKTWQLSGDTAKLKEHVGHKVEVKGTTSASSGATGAASASSGGSSDTLTIKSMKHISPTCNAGK